MDILEKEPTQKLLKYIHALQWANNAIDIIGSSSLAANRYKTDFDFTSDIRKSTRSQPYDKIMKILKKVTRLPGMYFIEIKIQMKDGTKIKHQSLDSIKPEDFEDLSKIEFVKLDFVAFIEQKWHEVSVNYFFDTTAKKSAEYVRELKQEYDELVADKQLYKALKRRFSIFKLQGKKAQLVELMKFFNSENGAKYAQAAQLGAIQRLLEKDMTPDVLRKVQTQLSVLDVKDIDQQNVISKIKSRQREINEEINEAAKIYI
jgi:hypothetical protein